MLRGTLDGRSFVIQPLAKHNPSYKLQHLGTAYTVHVLTQEQAALARHMLPEQLVDQANTVRSPMPGKIISLAVNVGDKVYAGQELAVVEAMKMQNVLRAARDGVVASIPPGSKPGADVALDQVLIELVPATKAAPAKGKAK